VEKLCAGKYISPNSTRLPLFFNPPLAPNAEVDGFLPLSLPESPPFSKEPPPRCLCFPFVSLISSCPLYNGPPSIRRLDIDSAFFDGGFTARLLPLVQPGFTAFSEASFLVVLRSGVEGTLPSEMVSLHGSIRPIILSASRSLFFPSERPPFPRFCVSPFSLCSALCFCFSNIK